MENLTRLTGGGVQVKIGEEEYTCYPLRFLDWGLFEQWMRSQIIADAAASLNMTSLNSAVAKMVMRTAYDKAEAISISRCFKQTLESGTREVAYLETFEGMLRIVHLSLRDKPGKQGTYWYTLQEVDELVDHDFDLLTELFAEVFDVSFPNLKRETSDEKNSPKETKP